MTIDELFAELRRRAELHGGDRKVHLTYEGRWGEVDTTKIYFSKDNALVFAADGDVDESEVQAR